MLNAMSYMQTEKSVLLSTKWILILKLFASTKKEFLALPIRNANRLYHEVFTIMIKMIEEGGIRNVRVFNTEIDGKCLVTPTTGISTSFACAYK